MTPDDMRRQAESLEYIAENAEGLSESQMRSLLFAAKFLRSGAEYLEHLRAERDSLAQRVRELEAVEKAARAAISDERYLDSDGRKRGTVWHITSALIPLADALSSLSPIPTEGGHE